MLLSRSSANVTSPVTRAAYYPALDGLRGIAVLLVFFQHYLAPYTNSPRTSWGWVGVDIFFVLSGFLITGILVDSRGLIHYLRNFYVRRSLRIFPLFYGVFALLLVLTPFLEWNWNLLWLLWPVYLGNLARFLSLTAYHNLGLDTLISANTGFRLYLGHLWSLCLEEQFYLLWPVVVLFVPNRRKLLQLCAVVILLSPLLRALALYTVPERLLEAEILYRLLPFRFDSLLIGGALALLQRGHLWSYVIRHARTGLLLLTLIFAVSWYVSASILHQSSSAAATNPWISTVGFTLIDLTAAAILVLCLEPYSLPFRLFTLRPLVALGRISYGFYVFHDIPHFGYGLMIQKVSPNSQHTPILTAALALPCTIGLATLSFRFFESPLLRLKDRFTLRSVLPSPHP